MASRPTSDVSDVILDSLDGMFDQLRERLAGLTTNEYLWEPVANMWSVRDSNGTPTVQGIDERDADPASVTTIAWRMWHIASDCLASYTLRLRCEPDEYDARWTADPDEAIERMQAAWDSFRAELVGRNNWWELLGDRWGPYAEHSIADIAVHAGNELVHHGAEIALLRDLYRSGLTR